MKTPLMSLFAAGMLALIAGCTSEASSNPSEAPKANAAVEAKLAAADAVDGTVDKIVHKCAGCSLGMDGKAEHAVTVQGYTMHFCSDTCEKPFADAPEAKILALDIENK